MNYLKKAFVQSSRLHSIAQRKASNLDFLCAIPRWGQTATGIGWLRPIPKKISIQLELFPDWTVSLQSFSWQRCACHSLSLCNITHAYSPIIRQANSSFRYLHKYQTTLFVLYAVSTIWTAIQFLLATPFHHFTIFPVGPFALIYRIVNFLSSTMRDSVVVIDLAKNQCVRLSAFRSTLSPYARVHVCVSREMDTFRYCAHASVLYRNLMNIQCTQS